jgi:hypothetical protein
VAKQVSPPAPKAPPNVARVVDYDQSFLSETVKKLKVGQSVNLTISGQVTGLEERYGANTLDNKCEVELEPTSVKVSKASGGSMVDQINGEKKKRGGGYYADDTDTEDQGDG